MLATQEPGNVTGHITSRLAFADERGPCGALSGTVELLREPKQNKTRKHAATTPEVEETQETEETTEATDAQPETE